MTTTPHWLVYYERTFMAVFAIIAVTVLGLVRQDIAPGVVVGVYQGVMALFVAGNIGERVAGEVDTRRVSVRKLILTVGVVLASVVFGALRDDVDAELLIGSITGALGLYAGGRAAAGRVG